MLYSTLSTIMHIISLKFWTRQHGFYSCLCVFLVVLNSCKIASDFPLTINDIDTLSVYKEHHRTTSSLSDSIKPVIVADSTLTDKDSAVNTLPKSETIKPWTICAGVFKEKSNAQRMFEQLNHFGNIYIMLRDSSYFVTIGSFTTRDSAQLYKKNKALTGTYIMKLKPNELLSVENN